MLKLVFLFFVGDRILDIASISAIVAAGSVVVTALAIIMQSRKAEKTRKTELLAMLFSPFNDPVLVSHWNDIVNHSEWKDYEDYSKKYGQNNIEASKFISTASFLNSLGLLVRMHLLETDIVQRWSPESCIWFWEKMEPIIQEAIRRLKAMGRTDYGIWENIEYLYKELKQSLQVQQ